MYSTAHRDEFDQLEYNCDLSIGNRDYWAVDNGDLSYALSLVSRMASVCGAARRSPPITWDLRPRFMEFCRRPIPTATLGID